MGVQIPSQQREILLKPFIHWVLVTSKAIFVQDQQMYKGSLLLNYQGPVFGKSRELFGPVPKLGQNPENRMTENGGST